MCFYITYGIYIHAYVHTHVYQNPRTERIRASVTKDENKKAWKLWAAIC